MGDHEVIVAQTARQSIESGDWVVPQYLDTPFLVKPPLPAWLVGGTSKLASTVWTVLRGTIEGDLVTAVTARLPSVVATILTILVLYRLGSTMFGRRTGFIAAFVYACSLGTLLYAFNATAEALLTFFCTWAFAEFWWAHTARTPASKRWHMLLFYAAFGLAMLAKGPMPLMLVATPIAAWWWLHRPMRLLAAGGARSAGSAVKLGALDAWPRLRTALTSLGLWWGIPVFLLMFVPWMFAAASRTPYAWDLWHYEYLDRLKGEYPGCESGQYEYYLPRLFGLMTPWLLSLPEALAAPFLQRYRSDRKPLLFAWFWVVCGVVLMSMMSFKKVYYIVPVLPGCALLLAPVLREFFFRISTASPRFRRTVFYTILGIWAAGWSAMWFVAKAKYPEIWTGRLAAYSPVFVVFLVAAVAVVGWAFLRDRRLVSFLTLGVTSVVAFTGVWCVVGARLDNLDDPLELVDKLRLHGIDRQAKVYWAGNRPDGRVTFYGKQPIRQILDPYKLVSEHEMVHNNSELVEYVGSHIVELLNSAEPIFVVFQRDQVAAIRMYYEPDPPMHELFSVDRGHLGHDEDDWVVVTNEARAVNFAPLEAHDRRAFPEAESAADKHASCPASPGSSG